jgi:uncharacterized damage-inducible protein DinB
MNYLRQFQYNEEIIGRYIDVLIDQPSVPDQAKKLLSHVLNAMEIWVSRIEHREAKCDVWDVHQTDKLHPLNRTCHEAVFQLLETGNLMKLHPYQNTKGQQFSNTLDEVLTHLIIHSAHHRAQIASALSEQGIQPPVCDFIFWARETSR